MENARTTPKEFTLACPHSKHKGTLSLQNCSLRNFHSFFDLIIKNGLNLVPIIAVDYSLANLTMDETQYCIHTLKPGAPNDYIDALTRVANSFKNFSKFMLAYGHGAKTVNSEAPACNLFSMTGDFQDPFVETEEELVKAYVGSIRSVKLALPINFQEIIKLVCNIA